MTEPQHDSRSANQSKTEPFPASPAEREAPTPGEDVPQGTPDAEQVVAELRDPVDEPAPIEPPD